MVIPSGVVVSGDTETPADESADESAPRGYGSSVRRQPVRQGLPGAAMHSSHA